MAREGEDAAVPHPLLLGTGTYVPPEPDVPVRDAKSSYSAVYIRRDDTEEDLRKLFKDDEDLVEIMTIILSSGVLDK